MRVRTLRQSGGMQLVAVPVGEGMERFYLIAGGGMVAGGFSTLAEADARFEALRRVAVMQAEQTKDSAVAGGGAVPPESLPSPPSNVTDLAEYRRRRRG